MTMMIMIVVVVRSIGLISQLGHHVMWIRSWLSLYLGVLEVKAVLPHRQLLARRFVSRLHLLKTRRLLPVDDWITLTLGPGRMTSVIPTSRALGRGASQRQCLQETP